MPEDQNDKLEKLYDSITNVRLDLRELSTKVDGIKDLTQKLEMVQDTSTKSFESSKAAHHRLDDMQVQIRWLFGTTISLAVLFLTALGLLWKVAPHG